MTREEEQALGRQLQRRGTGDPDSVATHESSLARDRFVRANLRLVWSIAKRYQWIAGVEIKDLFQEGTLGLIQAVERFDPQQGTRFSTYAAWWILKAIRHSIDHTSRTIRLPSHTLKRLRDLRGHEQALEEKLGAQDIQAADLAAAMGTTEDDVVELLAIRQRPANLEEPTSADPSQAQIDTLVDQHTPSPEEQVERLLLNRRLQQALGALPSVERRLMELRYGLATTDPQTLQSIGQQLGINRERVSRMEQEILQSLRECAALRGAYQESGALTSSRVVAGQNSLRTTKRNSCCPSRSGISEATA